MRLKRTLLLSGMSLSLLIVMGQIRGSHDEPVVIDNGPVVVSRRIRNTEHGPFKEEGKDSWQIHHTQSFVRLYAKVKRGNMWGNVVPFELDGIDRIGVELEGPGTSPRVALSTKGIFAKTARIHSSVDLLLNASPDQEDPKKIKYQFSSKDLERYRVKYLVLYDDADGQDEQQRVCLRDERAPHLGKCDENSPPEEIHVDICVTQRDCSEGQR